MKLPYLKLKLPMGGNLEAEEKDKIKREDRRDNGHARGDRRERRD